MENREHVNCQESITFGNVGAVTTQGPSADCADDTLSMNVRVSSAGDLYCYWILEKKQTSLFLLLVQETLSDDRTEQNARPTVNYGPCIICHDNKACILFIGCNHLASCVRCSETCGNYCPVPNCNHPIIERLRVFESM